MLRTKKITIGGRVHHIMEEVDSLESVQPSRVNRRVVSRRARCRHIVESHRIPTDAEIRRALQKHRQAAQPRPPAATKLPTDPVKLGRLLVYGGRDTCIPQ
jgi:hypothetical protein